MASNKKKPSQKSGNGDNYHGGLTFKQFRRIGQRPFEMNDIAWAGRLFPKARFWSNRLSKITTVSLAISVLCLSAMWVAVLMRKPALLLGVYPDGEMICFPRLRNAQNQDSPIHSSYSTQCSDLESRVGRKWQVSNAQNKNSDRNAIGDINKHVEYKKIEDVVAQVPAPAPLDQNKQSSVVPSAPPPAQTQGQI